MVKTQGPILGLQASGSLGGALIYSNWKGRGTLRKLTKPAQPRTALQIASRAMMKYLGIHWAELSAYDQSSWTELATQTNISPYNAYLSHALKRWRHFKPPLDNPTLLEEPVESTFGESSATGSVRQITLWWEWSAIGNAVGVIIHRLPDEETEPSLNTVIAVITTPTAAVDTYIETPLTPGLYYYRIAAICPSGTYGEPTTTVMGEVT